jgi:hypothetical protein
MITMIHLPRLDTSKNLGHVDLSGLPHLMFSQHLLFSLPKRTIDKSLNEVVLA